MWFELKGDARLGRCATQGCGQQPVFRLEAGGNGSNYCSACRGQIDDHLHDDDGYDDDGDFAGDDEAEAEMNCGKYPGSHGCSLAGTEWCDWSCPFNRT